MGLKKNTKRGPYTGKQVKLIDVPGRNAPTNKIEKDFKTMTPGEEPVISTCLTEEIQGEPKLRGSVGDA